MKKILFCLKVISVLVLSLYLLTIAHFSIEVPNVFAQQGTLIWNTKAPMPTPKALFGLVTTNDGKIYSIGGQYSSSRADAPLAEVYQYDPILDTWTSRTSLPKPTFQMGTTVGSNGKIYVIGGISSDGLGPNYISSRVEEYDPVANTWTDRTPIPTPRYGLAAVAATNGKIYAIGGVNTSGILSTVEEYDPETNTWRSRTPIHNFRYSLAAVATSDGKIYALGGIAPVGPGYPPDNSPMAVESYDTTTDTWTSRTSMLSGGGIGATLADNGKIYAIGGDGDFPYFARVQEYDPVTDTWAQLPYRPIPRYYAGVTTSNGKIYAMGGLSVNDSLLNIIEEATININEAPTVDANGPYQADEGVAVQVSATGKDPENGPLTYAWDLDNNGSFETPGQSVTFSSAGLDGPSTKTIGVQATDNGNLTATDQATVNITNVAPNVITITAPTDPQLVNTTINTSASFTDNGIPDTHTAVWDWQDGTSTGIVTESNGSGTVTGSHTYTTAGVYTITLTVTDDDLAFGSNQFMYVVVYNPEGGFLTGAGRFDAPVGSIPANPTASGMTNFRTNAKYVNNVLTGATRLNFRDGQYVFGFDSTAYDWLTVTNGNLAQLHGSGTVNGLDGYTFHVTALDNSPDTVRVQIWDATNTIVYDNNTSSVSNGNIEVHN